MTTTTNNKSIIDTIKEYNKEKGSKPIYIPSHGKDVMFSPLTVKHQKMIVGSNFDNPITNTTFNLKVYDIIKETCSDPNIISMLTLLDKDAILIQLRYNFVSKTFKKQSLDDIVSSIKKLKISLPSDVIHHEGIEMSVFIPSLEQENALLKQFMEYREYDLTFKNSDEVREVIGDVYVLELMKYLYSLSIGDDTIVFSDWSIEDKIEIVESLHKKIIDGVSDFIEKIREPLQSMYILPDGERFSITPEFFV